MRERLRDLVADVFGLAPADVPDDASPDTIPAWDSLHHLELMLGLELEFGVKISTQDIPELLSVEAIEAYLREQGVAEAA
jgi:acyl carrier protein